VDYHSEQELIDRMVHTVCNGGNYLLNNGPMGNGQLDPEAVRLYRILGEWLKVNGESIYETRPNPTGQRPEWGDISTCKDAQTLYLHILKWPASGTIRVDGLNSTASAASFLATGDPAELIQEGDSLEIKLPAQPLNPYNTVVKVSF
jgi:alpha-L-fucosidase